MSNSEKYPGSLLPGYFLLKSFAGNFYFFFACDTIIMTKNKGDFDKMGKIIAITNQKGGVGKTTTAVNLSACLANLGKKVLMVDLDPQGNGTSGLGIVKKPKMQSVYSVLIEDVDIKKCIAKTQMDNLKVLPSTIELAGAEIELVSMVAREFILKNALENVKEEYDYIIIDCPPSLGLLTLNALSASDSILIPIQCEFYALEGLGQLINTVNLIQKKLNPKLELEGILLTMFDSRRNLSAQVVDEVKKHFKDKVYPIMIPRNVRLSEAPSYGMPIILYDVSSKGAECYSELAHLVLSGKVKKQSRFKGGRK